MGFPIDFGAYAPLVLNPTQDCMTVEQKEQLETNISLVRDAIILITALGKAKGVGGHTGGAYDIVPEYLILEGFARHTKSIHPVLFDEAGHRVAIHYVMAALNKEVSGLTLADLLRYREHGSGLPGHPERELGKGIGFSSGRLGHLWSHVNGVAIANPEQQLILFSSDGSQQEGNSAEAARFAVAQGLNVNVIIDDNDITINGRPTEYLQGYDLKATMAGHGLTVEEGPGEELDRLYAMLRQAVTVKGPAAVVVKRTMAPGVEGIEGSAKGHDAISVELAIPYLEKRGHTAAVQLLKEAKKPPAPEPLPGSNGIRGKNRDAFGTILCELIERLPQEERKKRIRIIDSDLAGSCGLHHLQKRHPTLFISGGIMERNNFSVAAGFGVKEGRQGVFATFSAFLEMLISEITMARLNQANVLAHFSHAGVDDMADNTCHFGINNFFADNALAAGDTTRLYFPADTHQLRAIMEHIFDEPGLRFIFSTRSSVPYIVDEHGEEFFAKETYRFEPDKDEVIREGKDGYVVSYGEMLYRSLAAVEMAREKGLDIGLINKPTLNVIDEEMLARLGKSPFVLLVESQNRKQGLGSRFGTWLLERGLTPHYAHLGTWKGGAGGTSEQIGYQGLDPENILAKIKELAT